MTYFVHLSIEFKQSPPIRFEQRLNELGLSNRIAGSKGPAQLPKNTFAGEFRGENAQKVRDDLRSQVKEVLRSFNVGAKLFVTVSDNWTWGTSDI
jgi:hypothetical protein